MTRSPTWHSKSLLWIAVLLFSASCATQGRQPIGEAPSDLKGDAAVKSTGSDTTAAHVEVVPVFISMPPPVYPDAARLAGEYGVVTVKALVGRDGRVQDVIVVNGGITLLNDSAIAAVRKARFKPALQDGKPIAVWLQIPVRFSLD